MLHTFLRLPPFEILEKVRRIFYHLLLYCLHPITPALLLDKIFI